MGSQTFNTTANPTVVVNGRNDVIVMGWDQLVVNIEFDDPGDAAQEDAVIKVRTRGDCRINMPRGGTLLIERANNSAHIEEIAGSIQVRGVGDDLRLRDVGDTIIDAVGNRLDARGVSGSLVARSVGGAVFAQSVSGNVAINAVGSSIELREIEGRFIGDSVGGSVRFSEVELASNLSIGGSGEFRMNPAPGENYRVSAGGSINCQFADTANARISVTDGRGAREMILGTGAASIALSAGGSVSIRNKAFEAREPSPAPDVNFDFVFDRLEDAFDNMGFSFDRFGEGLGHLGSLGERIADRARKAAERAGEKARRRAEKEAARAQRIVERETERAARRSANWSWSWATPPPSPGGPPAPTAPPGPSMPLRRPAGPDLADATPPHQPVGDEERMAILRMVEQKKITVEQAELLLRALDG
ncbi:MAG TPA: hypothetical protein PLG23_08730 [Thermoflexales bacterium]|nr:hypothetical protein [Anaerolineae bacterium]HQX10047.1 hypothetical protein [Thermoflexales bacterium]HQY24122.1 hypothetical protein [Thermoflexales bacterium]HQZ53536.1 hypothetical protein [Thermoflexales bacterium]HRA53334.1 hypothetical protein [Thermoflexales bacterium]